MKRHDNLNKQQKVQITETDLKGSKLLELLDTDFRITMLTAMYF